MGGETAQATRHGSVHQPVGQEIEQAIKLSVIMPVYNEAATLREAVRRVCQAPFSQEIHQEIHQEILLEILLVDDGSTDGSTAIVHELATPPTAAPTGPACDIKVFFHQRNWGKGAAIRTALAAVSGDIVLIQDADLEYDPAEYPQLLAPIVAGHADVVYGSRFLGSPRRVLFFWHMVGNRLLTLLSNMLTNLNLTDLETGYKVFRTELLHDIAIRSNRFGFEPEITAKIARRRARIYEVPISYTGRTYAEGKKIRWTDGLAAVWTIVRYNLIDDTSPAGEKTLRRISGLSRYNRWLWEQVEPFTGQQVLEVGAGIGTMTRYLLGRHTVLATELEAHYVDRLRDRFSAYPNITVQPLDLNADPPGWLTAQPIDTVLCLNVLEHIEDDQRTIDQFYSLLPVGGRVVLIVPALRPLYGAIDRAIGHHRRYERAEIGHKLRQAGFQVEELRFFNTLGIAGWYLNSCVFKRQTVPSFQARINDFLVPLLRFEKHLQLPWGMSLLAVGRKGA